MKRWSGRFGQAREPIGHRRAAFGPKPFSVDRRVALVACNRGGAAVGSRLLSLRDAGCEQLVASCLSGHATRGQRFELQWPWRQSLLCDSTQTTLRDCLGHPAAVPYWLRATVSPGEVASVVLSFACYILVIETVLLPASFPVVRMT